VSHSYPIEFHFLGTGELTFQFIILEVCVTYLIAIPIIIWSFYITFNSLKTYEEFSKDKISMIQFFGFELTIQLVLIIFGIFIVIYNLGDNLRSIDNLKGISIAYNYSYYSLTRLNHKDYINCDA
jgi:hypothetical protein